MEASTAGRHVGAIVREGEFVSIPSAWSDMDWVSLDSATYGNVPGPCWKVLREGGGAMTYVMHIPPGWLDPVVDWHPSVEEVFKLAGSTEFPDTLLEKWSYLYRPPGILHGPAYIPTDIGNTSYTRMWGELEIFRYDGDEFPHVHKQPVTDDHKTWPIEWSEHTDLLTPPWEPIESGPWKGASFKRATLNKVNGGGSVLLNIPAGWSGAGSAAIGRIEEFVVEGSFVAGDVEYTKWGYMCRPKGMPAGEYSSEEGAVLFCHWDDGDEIAP